MIFPLRVGADMQKRFPYNASWKMVFLVCGFFGLCAVVLGKRALQNDRGLIINGIITLDHFAANIFFWSLVAAAMTFVLMGIAIAARKLLRPVELVFDENELVLPHGFMQRLIDRIPYSQMEGATEIEVSGQKMVQIYTAKKKYVISATLLGNRKLYEQAKEVLYERIARKS